MAKYYLLGRINQEYITGMLQDPDQDRSAAVKKACDALGLTFHSLEFTRGNYDVVCICDAPDFESVLALKTTVMRGGAMAGMDVIEVFDFNSYANKTAGATNNYTAPQG